MEFLHGRTKLRAPSTKGSKRLQESKKFENSLIAQDKRPPIHLSKENLMTLKSPTQRPREV